MTSYKLRGINHVTSHNSLLALGYPRAFWIMIHERQLSCLYVRVHGALRRHLNRITLRRIAVGFFLSTASDRRPTIHYFE